MRRNSLSSALTVRDGDDVHERFSIYLYSGNGARYIPDPRPAAYIDPEKNREPFHSILFILCTVCDARGHDVSGDSLFDGGDGCIHRRICSSTHSGFSEKKPDRSGEYSLPGCASCRTFDRVPVRCGTSALNPDILRKTMEIIRMQFPDKDQKSITKTGIFITKTANFL